MSFDLARFVHQPLLNKQVLMPSPIYATTPGKQWYPTSDKSVRKDAPMRCPRCGHTESKVIDSRPSEAGDVIRRRRECLNQNCKERFTTYERREEVLLQVRKKDGFLEPFSREKLLKSLLTATVKRKISLTNLNALIDRIEALLRNDFRNEVSSSELGDLVLKELLNLDKVAYVRFASVYKDFQDLDSFYNLLADLGR